MYTGDDFHYDELILGDGVHQSDALLGHLRRDRAGRVGRAAGARRRRRRARYRALLAPTVPLSRHVFDAPTFHYKTGIVFLAYLNGHQDHFRMLGGLESGRSVAHLGEAFALADRAGLLRDPELATDRMRAVLRAGRDRMNGLERLSLNQATVQRWSALEAIDGCARPASGSWACGATRSPKRG